MLPPPPTTAQRHRGWEMGAGSPAFDPRDSGKVSAWLRLANATVTGSGYSSVPDALGGAAAVQATDGRRPVNGTSANGLPIATFTDDLLQWPLANTTISTSPKAGLAFWIKCTPDGTVRRIVSVRVPGAGGGASANRLELCSDTNGTRGLFIDIYIGATDVRRAATAAALTAATWLFVSWEFDGSQSTDATKCLLTIGGTAQTLTFSDASGTPGAMPATLNQPTGDFYFGAQSTVPGLPFVGTIGPNIFALNAQLTSAERTALMNFEAPT